jgi:hypothetical protein
LKKKCNCQKILTNEFKIRFLELLSWNSPYTGVPELPPQRKREYLDKCDNLNVKEKKVLSQAIIEKSHPKLDQSELSTIEVG